MSSNFGNNDPRRPVVHGSYRRETALAMRNDTATVTRAIR